MLINLTNHPFEKWDIKQKETALSQFGIVEDIPFPEIDPLANTKKVEELAKKYISMCSVKMTNVIDSNSAVHISGEPCFLFQFVTQAKINNLTCVCSTTRRIVTEENNIKKSVFKFERFRNYY
jgi:hypothetical protein